MTPRVPNARPELIIVPFCLAKDTRRYDQAQRFRDPMSCFWDAADAALPAPSCSMALRRRPGSRHHTMQLLTTDHRGM